MKYFYYISKSKVDMLQAQISKPWFSLSSINYKLGVDPASVTLSTEKQNQTLVGDTIKLLKSLEKKKFIKPSESSEKLDTSFFYHDQSYWKSGLFSLNSIGGGPTVIYALWKKFSNSIILLVGSPNNILGEKVVAGNYTVSGTSGAYLEILSYIDTFLQTDENNAVYIYEPDTYGQKISIPRPSNSEILVPQTLQAENNILDGIDRLEFFSNHRGLTLSFLCFRQLHSLQKTKLDLVFRIFSSYEIPHKSDIEKWKDSPNHRDSWEADGVLHMAEKLGIFNYERIYLGSPVYTALD